MLAIGPPRDPAQHQAGRLRAPAQRHVSKGVEVKGRFGDGGIDGTGMLRLNFVSF